MTEQMLDYYEFNSHHNKVIRAIRSCETLEQLEIGKVFADCNSFSHFENERGSKEFEK